MYLFLQWETARYHLLRQCYFNSIKNGETENHVSHLFYFSAAFYQTLLIFCTFLLIVRFYFLLYWDMDPAHRCWVLMETNLVSLGMLRLRHVSKYSYTRTHPFVFNIFCCRLSSKYQLLLELLRFSADFGCHIKEIPGTCAMQLCLVGFSTEWFKMGQEVVKTKPKSIGLY